ncbi:unnamed protein product [Paramecium octaurelia]|uniref:Uncharacterized protein n=1 Tax=Paramecium octaurelia TaxID=43137 RepID=A0A8S1TRD7_PAROT|nr:unnamed protein product [Paramecium octaurelia]
MEIIRFLECSTNQQYVWLQSWFLQIHNQKLLITQIWFIEIYQLLCFFKESITLVVQKIINCYIYIGVDTILEQKDHTQVNSTQNTKTISEYQYQQQQQDDYMSD